MKLLYTDMSQDLTEILTEQATSYAQKGKRVFYIAPNALSFEKERKVLEYLPQSASFEITVTRFTQMARYFILNTSNPKTQLDDTGLAMIFYKVLSHMDDDELKVYGRLRKDSNFINQLVDLYKELQQANMTVLDLQHLDQVEKQEDLLRIFSAAQDLLLAGDFDNQSKLSAFFKEITSGHLDKALSNTVLVIDGFTRFSAEEEALVALLNDKCHQIVIGTYTSQKAYSANFVYGNVYQASVDFLRTLAQTYKVTPDYVTTDKEGNPSFARISRLLESRHDFSTVDEQLTDQDKQALQVWEVVNQKEEVAQVAKSIRQLLADGKRYKDILVLLGDEESYKLQVGQIFRKFDIPYYFGKEETMSSHPLVQFVDSLERIKRYNYRAEDLLNLIKSGLYGGFAQEDLDLFEYYVNFADIKGRHKFLSDFTANSRDKYDLDQLNTLRSQLVEPLDKLLNSRKQKGSSLLKKLVVFLEAVQVPSKMAALTGKASEAEKEQNEQVWKAFTQLLEQVETIFGEETLSVDDFLSILRSGMLACDYRTVPATVDVVNVKKYDLIQPHSAPYVFALGMTQSHFPKVGQNKSLLSDEERSRINEATDEDRSLDIVTQSNSQRGHFVAMSLFNAASEQLVLSQPQILNETQDDMSVYLKELLDLGLPLVEKGRNRFEAKGDQIGNYKDLLSTVIALNSSQLDADLDKETQTFWSVAVRYLRKRLDKDQVLIPNVIDDVTTTKVDDQVMQLVFPGEEPLKLSASALTTFYNNQYLYFLRYVLGLQDYILEDGKIHTRYVQDLTQTGRLSSVDPNLQNIPVRLEQGRLIRKAFVPSTEDAVLLSSDYSQIELRVLAHISGDEHLIAAFKEGADIHTSTAMRVFGIEKPEDVTPNDRRNAKAVNFGIVYGISDFGLSNNLGISRKKAKEYIDTYFERYPGIKAYMDNVVREAKDKGYVETLFHRRRELPDINSRNFNVRNFAERTAINSPIQGSAADILKIAMINLDKALVEGGYKTKMLLQVHDEIVLEVPNDELVAMKALVKETMEAAVELAVPLIADENDVRTWYEAK